MCHNWRLKISCNLCHSFLQQKGNFSPKKVLVLIPFKHNIRAHKKSSLLLFQPFSFLPAWILSHFQYVFASFAHFCPPCFLKHVSVLFVSRVIKLVTLPSLGCFLEWRYFLHNCFMWIGDEKSFLSCGCFCGLCGS